MSATLTAPLVQINASRGILANSRPVPVCRVSQELSDQFLKGLFRMGAVGKKLEFHGKFTNKNDAVKREQEVHGFIRERKVKGRLYYFVLTAK